MSLKLINFRCPHCGYEEEQLLTKEELETLFFPCPKCGDQELEQFNFKNNSQRVFICDPPTK